MKDKMIQNILTKNYLTEDKLYEALKIIFKVDFIRDRQVPESGINKRPDFRNDELKLIVEFDGDRHYSNNKIQKSDILKYKVYTNMGYKVIHIPYFIQLSTSVIKLLFNIDLEWEQQYPHGFIDEKAMLPVDYNYLGVNNFKTDLLKFKEISTDIIDSLKAKIELLGVDNVLPYGMNDINELIKK